MKKKTNQKSAEPQTDKSGRPTLLEFTASFHSEANKQFGTKFLIDPDLLIPPLPDWANNRDTAWQDRRQAYLEVAPDNKHNLPGLRETDRHFESRHHVLS